MNSEPLWPAEILEFREAHLRTDAHRTIVAIAKAEHVVGEVFGFNPTAEPAPCADARTFALNLLRLEFAESDADAEAAKAVLVAIRARRCQ